MGLEQYVYKKDESDGIDTSCMAPTIREAHLHYMFGQLHGMDMWPNKERMEDMWRWSMYYDYTKVVIYCTEYGWFIGYYSMCEIVCVLWWHGIRYYN